MLPSSHVNSFSTLVFFLASSFAGSAAQRIPLVCYSEMVFQICGKLSRNLLSTDLLFVLTVQQLLFFSSASNSKYCQSTPASADVPDVPGVSSLLADSENISDTGGAAILKSENMVL